MTVAFKRMTYQEFRQLEFDGNDNFFYEIINGEIVKKSAPSPRHQELSSNAYDVLKNHIKQKDLGKLFYAPIDVFLDEYCVPQPDLVFVSQENLHKITKDGIECVPDLVVEVISPGSVIRDRIDKKNMYERFGVKEFWLIDPQNEEIEIYFFLDNRFELLSAATRFEGELKSKLFAELVINLEEIFEA